MLLAKLSRWGWGKDETAGMSAGADTKANTRGQVRGCGVLELLDLRLFEDGGELGRALNSDFVAIETASKGWSGNGQ